MTNAESQKLKAKDPIALSFEQLAFSFIVNHAYAEATTKSCDV
jgi:hypothetical protein